MAGELQVTRTTGQTVYAMIFSGVGQVWDAVDGAFEVYATAQIANYDVALTELGTASQVYTGTFPATIGAGTYWVHYRQRAGGAPAETDTIISTERIEWNGSVRLSRAAWAHMDADPIGSARTWRARADRTLCREIIEVTVLDTAVYAMDFGNLVNPGASLLTADSVSDVSGNALVTSGLALSQDKLRAHFTVSATDLAADTDYQMRVTVTTTDGDTWAREGTLRCVP